MKPALGLELPLSRRQWIHLRDLLRELIGREMKLRYKRSALGIVWAVLNPLAQLMVFTFLFRGIFALDIPNFSLFVFTGVIAWNWFRDALMQATLAITNNRDVIKQPGFSPAVLPVVTVITHLIDFLVAIPILVLFMVFGSGRLTGALLALPVVIMFQFFLILGLSYMLATFHVTFRDTQHLLGVLLMLLFYLTPVFYDVNIIPARYLALYNLNPMVHLITAYREVLIQGNWPELSTLGMLALSIGGLLWLGRAIFITASYRFVEEL